MSLTLTLIRHAKSSWDGGEADHERPLNKRGRQSCKALGAWLEGRVPQEVLCSDAVRTRETWDRVSAVCGGPAATLLPDLYHADPDAMLAALRRAHAGHVAVVGHNPGIALFAGRIVGERPGHSRFADYPTGATTVVSFDAADWAQVGWGDGRVIDFVIPREI